MSNSDTPSTPPTSDTSPTSPSQPVSPAPQPAPSLSSPSPASASQPTPTSYRFSRRALNAQGSAIREMLKATRPDLISFAGGLPSPRLFDVSGIQESADAVLSSSPAKALQYGQTEGSPELRQALCDLMASRGLPCSPDQLLVTTGSQQGIDLLGKVMLDPGDAVALERPTYLAAIQIFSFYEANFFGVEVDAQGVDVTALEQILAQHRPKLLYLVPTFGNPSGVTLSRERRQRLLELVTRYQVLLVEDDPYSELRFSGEAEPPLIALATPEQRRWCVYLSSLSKILSPGMRLAWILAPSELLAKLTVAKQAADLHTSTLTQQVAAHYLASGRLAPHLQLARAAYSQQAQAMASALQRHFPPATLQFQTPQGGMFIWAQLSSQVNTAELLPKAAAEGVLFVPGRPFFATHPKVNYLRLSFATQTPEEIEEGVRRLARAIVD